MEIDSFKKIAHQDYLRGNRFDVQIVYPQLMGFDFGNIAMNVKSVEIPSVDYNTFDFMFLASPVSLPYGIINNDLVLTFMLSSSGIEMEHMQKWHSLIFDKDTRCFNYLNEYGGTITITEKDRHDRGKIKRTYYTAYPYSISSVTVDATQTDTIEEFNVSFRYIEKDIEFIR